MLEKERKKILWRIIMIGLPVIAIGAELISVYDGNPRTEPWTRLITTYISPWIFFPIVTAFYIWVIFHFIKHYSKKK